MCTASEADPAWDNLEEEVDDEVTEQAEQWREQQEQVERSEVADTTEELKTISLELSSCVAPPFLPSPQQLPPSGDHVKTLTAQEVILVLGGWIRAGGLTQGTGVTRQ